MRNEELKKNILYRYLLFMIGLVLNAFGVALITKASLGTTPISSIPYTLSLIIPELTIGNFTIIVSLILITAQGLILRNRAKFLDIILQVPICVLFGYVIDLSMWILTEFQPESYILKMLSLLAGCLILALGAYFEVVADVTMLPADGFTLAIAKVLDKEFGTIKLITDSSQAVIALALGLIFLNRLVGVREGTIIGALLVGNIVKFIAKHWKLSV